MSGNQIDFGCLRAEGACLAVGIKENINVTAADTAADIFRCVNSSVYIEAAADGNDGRIYGNGSSG